MALTDNRTQLVDGEAATDVSGETTAAPTGLSGVTGTIIEGTDSIEFQVDDAQEMLLFDLDTAGSTFNIDMSDMTVYQMIKFGTPEAFGSLGGLFVIGDTADGGGGDTIGYACVGSDVTGLPYEFSFFGMKLDVSVVVASPGTNNVDYYQYSGTEAGCDQTAIKQIGYGSFSLVKAVSGTPNAWSDGIYYIANDSYAASIVGGTVGTPETMADVAGDDVTAGAGMFNNPKGSEYGIFAPTEWGDSGTSDSYFTSDSEQWYFIGDNNGGHAVGATHFPMRLVGNGTGTNSWVVTNTVMVNTGTESQFDMSDVNMDTATMDGVTMINFGAIELPDAGTAKFTTSCTFLTCGIVTSNGGDMSGSRILTPDIAADEGGLVWNESTDPDGFLDNVTLTKTSGTDHHAITFGTSVTSDITLKGIAFDGGFSTSDDVNGSTLQFLATSGALTVSMVECTVDGAAASSSNIGVDDAAGITVTLDFNVPVTFDGMRDNTEVRVYTAGTKTELSGIEDATAGTTDDRSFIATVAGGTSVDYTLVNEQYEIIRVEAFTWPSAAATIQVQQRFDRNFLNPAGAPVSKELLVTRMGISGDITLYERDFTKP